MSAVSAAEAQRAVIAAAASGTERRMAAISEWRRLEEELARQKRPSRTGAYLLTDANWRQRWHGRPALRDRVFARSGGGDAIRGVVTLKRAVDPPRCPVRQRHHVADDCLLSSLGEPDTKVGEVARKAADVSCPCAEPPWR